MVTNHPQLHTVEPDLWDPATSFLAHPEMPQNVTSLRGTGWIDGLTKAAIYPACANLHQKIVVLTTLIPGLSGSRGMGYLASS